MLDQDGNPVPDDLVLFPDFKDLTEEEIEKVYAARWYESDYTTAATAPSAGRIRRHRRWRIQHIMMLVSAKEIDHLSDDDPFEGASRIDKSKVKIMLIDDCLKRGNDEDGFYHA